MKKPVSIGADCPGQSGLFPMTEWTQVADAKDADSSSVMEAMDSLARAYWPPLYVLARRRNLGHEEAADAVQGFLSQLLTREGMRRVERRETRFRAFLGTAFRNWLSNWRRREQSTRRGGGAIAVPIEEFDSLLVLPWDDGETPEQSFDRRWARSVYDQAMARLSAEQSSSERPEYFAALRGIVFEGGKRGGIEELAERFGVASSTVRKAASEMRVRFGRMLRREVERIVSAPSEVESELRYLLQLLSKP
jgi:RNA polymerase sigma-70 factor (ECF subfamily)